MKVKHKSFLEWWTRHRNRHRALCFDIDGTLIRGREALPGAIELVRTLRDEDFPFILLTNDGNNSREQKSAKLARAGLGIPPEDIISCGLALRQVAAERGLTGRLCFQMGELGSPNYAELAGLLATREISKIDHCAGVVVGESNYDWESTFNAVINFFIHNPRRPLLVPNPDSYWPNETGGICVGAGGKARFIEFILREYGVEIEVVYLGKPHRPIFDMALRILADRVGGGLAAADVLMLGDSLRSDILGANRAGFDSALLLTGITDLRHLELEKQARPDLVFPAIAPAASP